MPKIHFQSVNVKRIQNSSGLFYGENIQYKWKNRSGVYEGFGRVSGNGNKIYNNITVEETQEKKADEGSS
ncbi:hypothetical protein CEF21_07600 [Bacillus sp. FJAT-42376]|uniref:hypothetical protein n=1 Tax=Bacillus sp. FJAT-42376 TaxID=2014076 RepID=UPI000F4FB3FE|nr:hypothetical protein [Bacillus sp. FJAT-42376]AZB42164.1 hypothetical protein CEF21_07600 [Bacillus sp. FJAT-42376]